VVEAREEGPYRRIDFKFEYLGKFEVIFGTVQGPQSGDGETCFDQITAYTKSRVRVPL